MLQILESSQETIPRNYVGIATKEVKGNQIKHSLLGKLKPAKLDSI